MLANCTKKKKEKKQNMKTIIKASRELTKIETYKLTSSNSTQSIKGFENQIIEIDYWAKFTDADENGEVTEILSLATKDGEFIATNSSVVIRSFDEMIDVFGSDELPPVQIVTGKSKNNRTYYNIRLA